MGVTTQQYIRKPLYVDAVRVTSSNFDNIVAWCQGEVQIDEIPGSGVTKKYIKVRVHNPKNPRQTKAFIGDWLLYTERGYKVYTNKAFRGAFDLVEEPRGEYDPEAEESTPSEPAAVPSGIPPTPPDEEEIELVEDAMDELGEPQAIADAVHEQQPVAEHGAATGADPEFEGMTQQSEQPKEATDKRVLTEEEQQQMGADEVRDLVQSGEAVLAQDLA